MSMPVIRLRQSVQFPAQVYGDNGIDVSKVNGNYTIETNWNQFATTTVLPTSPTNNILTFDTVTDAYVLVPSTLFSGSTILEAPNDGSYYGRVSLGWGKVAPLDSAALTGVPTTPTAAPGTNTTQIASTAFVLANVMGGTPASASPIMDGVAAVGIATKYAREDHVHPSDTSRAPLVSPALTGTPTAPTATTGTNTVQIATTAFVNASVAAGTAGVASFNTRTGTVTLLTADITAAGGAPLASPLFTGTPSLPTGSVAVTQSTGDNSTKLATTAFVQADIAAEAVRYDAAQSLTGSQQTQARSNVYAAPFDALAYNGMQINGGMEISQENSTSLVSAINGYALDGWSVTKSGSMVLAAQQVTDAPSGYNNSLKITVTTGASLGSGDYAVCQQLIEGYRTSRLAFGTANAQSVSLGFWCKAHRTGSYSGSISNNASARSYPFSFIQNVSDTWEFKTVTIPGDTTGTWIGNTNGIGLRVLFCIGGGSGVVSTANTWAAANYVGVSGTINGVQATSDIFQITGLVVLPGIELPSATRAPLIMRSYAHDFVVCQRYLQYITGFSVTGQANTTASMFINSIIVPPMRIAPTPTLLKTSYAAGSFELMIGGTWVTNASASISGSTVSTFGMVTQLLGFSGLTLGDQLTFNTGATNLILLDARL